MIAIDPILVAAQREVDDLLPDTPPIAPPRRPPWWRTYERIHGRYNEATEMFADGTDGLFIRAGR